ncbi:MAG: DUF448 domain-containing protein [Candidatus Baltobacteraceae bacterium]
MPIRTCVGCRRRFEQQGLVRFTRGVGGAGWAPDPPAVRSEGRGAYLCSAECAVGVARNRRYPGLAAGAQAVDFATAERACMMVRPPLGPEYEAMN